VEAVPSCGWTTLKKGPAARVKNSLIAGKGLLENEYLRLTFNASGEITGIRDKQTGSELAEGACNSFRMYRDVPGTADAWDLDSHYKCSPVRLDARARVEVSGRGPLFASLKVTRKLNQSLMTQEIRLAAGSRRVDFITRIDWKERHKVLKVNFATDIKAEEALHEIQFGHIRRPNHASRQFDQDRFEVCNQKWTALAEENRGCAVLNDCKYGVNVEGGSINLTLLRSPLSPDEHADQGIQEFTYAFFAWKGSLAQSGLVQEAYDLNVPAQVAKGEGGRMSLLSLDAPNIVVEAVKPAEDQSGHLVVRLYESLRCTTACVLKTGLPLKAAWATDMLEKNRRPLKTMGNAIPLNFRPFEIKTLRLKI
jgi:alpha-mannosidase